MRKLVSFCGIIALFCLFAVPANAALTDSLAAYYDMEETSNASYLLDQTANNTLQPIGGNLYSLAGKLGNTRFINQSNYFRNDSIYIYFGNTTNITFSMWVKRNASETQDGIFLRAGGTGGSVSNYRWQNAGCTLASQVKPYIYENFATAPTGQTCITMPLQIWQMMTLIWDATNMRELGYVNGSLVSNSSYKSFTTITSPNNVLRLGTEYSNAYLIDEVGIWNRTLTQAEMTQLYNSGTGLNYSSIAGIVSRMNLTASDTITGSPISVFNVTIESLYNASSTFSQTKQVTTGQWLFNLSDTQYNVTITANGYAIYNGLTPILNTTGINNVSMSLQKANSFNVTFRNELTNVLMSGTNVTLQLIGDYIYNQTNDTGYAYFYGIAEGNYTLRYNASGYTTRFAYLAMTDREFVNTTLYLAPTTGATNITATVYNQYGDVLNGAFIYIFKYDFPSNDYLLTQVAQTNFLGEAVFDAYLSSEYYKFIIAYPVGNTRQTTTPTYLTSTSLSFIINTDDAVGSNFNTFMNVDGYLTFNTATNYTRFEYIDNDMSVSQGCIEVYRIYGNVSTVLYDTDCSSSSSGIVSVYINDTTNAVYLAKAVLTIDEHNYIFDELYIPFSSDTDYGILGLFAAIIVTLTWIFISKGNPVVMLIGAGFPLIFTTLLGWTGLPFWMPFGIEVLLITGAILVSKRA